MFFRSLKSFQQRCIRTQWEDFHISKLHSLFYLRFRECMDALFACIIFGKKVWSMNAIWHKHWVLITTWSLKHACTCVLQRRPWLFQQMTAGNYDGESVGQWWSSVRIGSAVWTCLGFPMISWNWDLREREKQGYAQGLQLSQNGPPKIGRVLWTCLSRPLECGLASWFDWLLGAPRFWDYDLYARNVSESVCRWSRSSFVDEYLLSSFSSSTTGLDLICSVHQEILYIMFEIDDWCQITNRWGRNHTVL